MQWQPAAGVTLQLDKHELTQGDGQWFEVSWRGIVQPAADDWVAVIVPADAEVNATAPAKWHLATRAPTHLASGAGTIRFKLISYRLDMAFLFIRGGFLTPVVVARSKPIIVKNRDEPLHGHLSLTADLSAMQVQWTTLHSLAPMVRWGEAPGALRQEAKATSASYHPKHMCGAPANTVGWVEAGLQHSAVMRPLKPGCRYLYVFGDASGGWSPEASFVAAPVAGLSSTVRLLAVADVGQGEEDGSLQPNVMAASLNTTRRMAREADDWGATLTVHLGDLSYAEGFVTQWDNFMVQLQPVATRMPYMTAPGNHERGWPNSGDEWGVPHSGGECGVAYSTRFKMPVTGRDQLWYSFNYGPVHFLMYSNEQPFAAGSPQYSFMEADLAAVDRSVTPWVVVGGHRPMYVSANPRDEPAGEQIVTAALRAALEDLFMQYQVDLTLHGHHHSYQRTCALYKGECLGVDGSTGVARAPVHLVVGNGGANISINFMDPPPPWLQAISKWWGYLRLEANATHLTTEAVSDLDGTVVDTLQLRKPNPTGHRQWGMRSISRGSAMQTTNDKAWAGWSAS